MNIQPDPNATGGTPPSGVPPETPPVQPTASSNPLDSAASTPAPAPAPQPTTPAPGQPVPPAPVAAAAPTVSSVEDGTTHPASAAAQPTANAGSSPSTTGATPAVGTAAAAATVGAAGAAAVGAATDAAKPLGQAAAKTPLGSATPPPMGSGAPSPLAGGTVLGAASAAPKSPSGGKGKLALIIGGVTGLVLLIAAILVYFLWYQSPQKIADDAMLKFGIATKSQVKFTTNEMKYKMNGQEMMIKPAEMRINYDLGEDFEMTMEAGLKAGGVDGDLGFEMRHTDDMDTYARLNKLTDLFDKALSSGDVSPAQKSQLESYRSILATVSDKWVSVPFKDIKENSKELADTMTCMKGVMGDKQKIMESSKKSLEYYAKHKFIVAGQSVSDGGKSGIRLNIDKEKLKSYLIGYAEVARADLKDGGAFADCMANGNQKPEDVKDISEKDAEKYAESVAELFNEKAEVVLWVDGFSHTLKGMRVKTKIEELGSGQKLDEPVDFQMDVEMEYDQNYKVQAPEDATDYKEVMQDFMKEYRSVSGSSPYGSSPRSGVRGGGAPMLPIGLPAMNSGRL